MSIFWPVRRSPSIYIFVRWICTSTHDNDTILARCNPVSVPDRRCIAALLFQRPCTTSLCLFSSCEQKHRKSSVKYPTNIQPIITSYQGGAHTFRPYSATGDSLNHCSWSSNTRLLRPSATFGTCWHSQETIPSGAQNGSLPKGPKTQRNTLAKAIQMEMGHSHYIGIRIAPHSLWTPSSKTKSQGFRG